MQLPFEDEALKKNEVSHLITDNPRSFASARLGLHTQTCAVRQAARRWRSLDGAEVNTAHVRTSTLRWRPPRLWRTHDRWCCETKWISTIVEKAMRNFYMASDDIRLGWSATQDWEVVVRYNWLTFKMILTQETATQVNQSHLAIQTGRLGGRVR